MRFSTSAGAALLSSAALVSAISFNPNDEASIKAVTKEYAFGLMSHYKNNATNTPAQDVGIFPRPHYWWAAGAAWGGMIEYSQFTGDASYIKTLHQALVSNYGPEKNILLPWRKDQEGNDDQAFWALSLMSALEFQFPDPQEAPTTYLEVVENAFNNIVSRWNTESCGGGLKWQIYPENAYGYNYKNSISNGAAFALGARLARYTGNEKYANWASKIFDWTKSVGLISDKFEVFDGADDKKNCADFDRTQWTYNIGMFLHGSAVMYNHTNGDEAWRKRTAGFIEHAGVFTYEGTDILSEVVCEENGKCNLDQQSFKAYFARFLGKTAIMAPFTRDRVTNWLKKSAVAAAKSCSGGQSGTECGFKWYTGGFDGIGGTGQQLSALEVTQALLMLNKNIVPATKGQSKPQPSSSPKPQPSSSAAPSSSSSAKSSGSIASSAVASSTPQSKAPGSSATSVAPASPSSTGNAPVGLPINIPASSGVCTCTPSSTVTIYVPPTPPPSATVPVVVPTISTRPGAPPPYPNGTIPNVPPPANTTGPIQFQGTATNGKTTTLSILGAAAVVIISSLL
ncbi:glycosyl hydrolase family 76-domain-containing protein [Dendryphion nanum]|uniref:mannan endo-1,6-alpha-mannosidase n=1 Tax=Dendryphion nanum TaxID=256645 RepID=A0A9P9EF00_9PLEO|nr:glycosyl hydrolase family 76-domain-containing protein [Dendryphion nanum]